MNECECGSNYPAIFRPFLLFEIILIFFFFIRILGGHNEETKRPRTCIRMTFSIRFCSQNMYLK